MQRVASNRNPAVDKFGAGKNGFTAGDPQTGVPATTPGYEWFDAVQEELVNLVEGLGGALDPTKRDQVKTLVLTALALKAPLASPALTGAPTAPTPAQFDSSTKVANMAAVQRALGNHNSVVGVTGSITLTQAQLGSFIEVTAGSGVVITLCSAVGAGGGTFRLYNNTANSVLVSAATGQNINVNRANVSSFTLMPGEACDIVTDGVSWSVINGIGASSLTANGYQKLPSGLIIQWGTVNITPAGNGGSATLTLPIAFPNAGLCAVANYKASAVITGGFFCYTTFPSASQLTVVADVPSADGPTTSQPFFWIAIGY